MSAVEIVKALRHDLKYAGFTIQNIDREKPLEPWAAKAIHKDIFSTRRGKSCLELILEAKEKLSEDQKMAALIQTATELEPWREGLRAGVLCQELYEIVRRMLKLSETLITVSQTPG
jgi:hypothetical protein